MSGRHLDRESVGPRDLADRISCLGRFLGWQTTTMGCEAPKRFALVLLDGRSELAAEPGQVVRISLDSELDGTPEAPGPGDWTFATKGAR